MRVLDVNNLFQFNRNRRQGRLCISENVDRKIAIRAKLKFPKSINSKFKRGHDAPQPNTGKSSGNFQLYLPWAKGDKLVKA